MEFKRPTPPEVLAGLRAMRTLLLSKGRVGREEEAFLETVQRAWGTNHDLGRLETITPEELAAEIPTGPLRRQIVAGLVALSLYDGEAHAAEIACIEAFAAGLGVPDTATRVLTQLADGHLRRMRFDFVMRRSAIRGRSIGVSGRRCGSGRRGARWCCRSRRWRCRSWRGRRRCCRRCSSVTRCTRWRIC